MHAMFILKPSSTSQKNELRITQTNDKKVHIYIKQDYNRTVEIALDPKRDIDITENIDR